MTSKELSKSAKKASQKAVADAFAKGLSITVQRGKRIVKVSPDGKEEILTVLDRAYMKTDKKSFSL
jgi:hypothetical protein